MSPTIECNDKISVWISDLMTFKNYETSLADSERPVQIFGWKIHLKQQIQRNGFNKRKFKDPKRIHTDGSTQVRGMRIGSKTNNIDMLK